jgi:hypothetical protein
LAAADGEPVEVEGQVGRIWWAWATDQRLERDIRVSQAACLLIDRGIFVDGVRPVVANQRRNPARLHRPVDVRNRNFVGMSMPAEAYREIQYLRNKLLRVVSKVTNQVRLHRPAPKCLGGVDNGGAARHGDRFAPSISDRPVEIHL